MKPKRVSYAAAAVTALALAFSPAFAELPARFNQQAWVDRAQPLIAAANDTTDDPDAYIDGLKSACDGINGDMMGVHGPNDIVMQQMGFCMAVNDLDKAWKALQSGKIRGGSQAYCGDLNQGIRSAQNMPNTPEYALIYPTSQQLLAAALKIKSAKFVVTGHDRRALWLSNANDTVEIDGGVKSRVMTCT